MPDQSQEIHIVENDSVSQEARNYIEQLTNPSVRFEINSNIFPYLKTTLHQTLHASMQDTYEKIVNTLNPNFYAKDTSHNDSISQKSNQNIPKHNNHSNDNIHSSYDNDEHTSVCENETLDASQVEFLQDLSSTAHKILQRHLESRIESEGEKVAMDARIDQYSCKGGNWEIRVRDLHDEESLIERVMHDNESKRKNAKEKNLRKVSLEGKKLKIYSRTISILPLKRKRI